MTDRTIVFLDTETTGLHRLTREIWDLAYIIRRPGEADQERQFFIDVSLHDADPFSLKIGGYWDRHPNPLGTPDLRHLVHGQGDVARIVARELKDALIVGAVPSFDEETLARLLLNMGLMPTWHYHLIDIETLAAGALGIRPPWSFDSVLEVFGLAYDEADRHTAIGDARMVRDLYDRVYGNGPAV